MDFIPVLKDCLKRVREHYSEYHFYAERDFQWTIQKMLNAYIEENHLPYSVFHGYAISEGKNPDLVIVSKDITDHQAIKNGKAQAELVIEFKYEPSKLRVDEFPSSKFPVTIFGEIVEDVNRVYRFVAEKKTKSAVAVLVDEFGLYTTAHYEKKIPEGCSWMHWGRCGSDKLNVSVLYTNVTQLFRQ